MQEEKQKRERKLAGLWRELLPAEVKIRCPECERLYKVHGHEVREPSPKFECLDCKTRFIVHLAERQDGVDGVPLGAVLAGEVVIGEVVVRERGLEKVAPSPETEVSMDVFTCPKCSEKYKGGQEECHRCGLVFKKWHEEGTPQFTLSNPSLEALWQQSIADYDNLEVHHNFIKACHEWDMLSFASQRYACILSVHPADEIAKKMNQEISALAEVACGVAGKRKKATARNKKRKSIWRFVRLPSLMYMLSGGIMVLGYLLPHFRNMVGVGAALLFFTLALQFYFLRSFSSHS